jgi:hypothetical protein
MPVSFVYQQKSRSTPREGADVCEIKCKRTACAIQKCLAKLPLSRSSATNAGVDVSKCQYAVDAYDACCERVKRIEANRSASSS